MISEELYHMTETEVKSYVNAVFAHMHGTGEIKTAYDLALCAFSRKYGTTGMYDLNNYGSHRFEAATDALNFMEEYANKLI